MINDGLCAAGNCQVDNKKIKKTDKISKHFPYDKQRLSNIRISIQFPFTFEYFEHNYY